MLSSQKLSFLLAAFLLGAGFGFAVKADWPFWWLAIFSGSFLLDGFILSWLAKRNFTVADNSVPKISGGLNPSSLFSSLGVTAFMIAFFLLGWMRTVISVPVFTENDLAFYNQAQPATLIGLVCEEPDEREFKTKLTVCAEKINGREIKGRALINASKYPQYAYGDRLKIMGALETPENFSADFNYERYLARYDIYSIVSQPKKITLLQSGVGNPLLQNLYAFKNLLLGKINALFNEPSASFSAGLLLGARRQIPANILEDFKTVGLTHILAISGYNIALVIIFCSTLFNFVSRKQKFWLVATGVIGFVFLVGPSASVVRAAIMGLLAFLALNLGRQAVVTANLFLAADLMILANPLILVADAGFQLSFLSVAGLIFLSPLLSEWFNKMPEKFGLREGLLLTLSASLATAPWIAYAFGRFSLIAPLANVLVAPAIPLAMAGIFCALVVGFIFPPLGALLAFLTNGFLSYILKVAEVLAKLPLASWETKMVDEKFLVIYYAVLVVLILRKNRREQLEA